MYAVIVAKSDNWDWQTAMVVNLVTISEELHSLPNQGALFDQDFMFIHLYQKVQEFRSIRRELDEANRRMSGKH